MKFCKTNDVHKLKNNFRIGLFGGSFDPVHNGHLKLARAAKDEYRLDKVFFIPAKYPPHKLNKKLLPATTRLKLLRLAVKPYKYFTISHCELARKSVTFTYQTAAYFRRLYPKAELFFIIGGDSLAELKTWKNVERLSRTVKFLVGKRAGVKNLTPVPFKDSVLFIHQTLPKVSSSSIRALTSLNKSLKALVPASVEKEILRKGMYN